MASLHYRCDCLYQTWLQKIRISKVVIFKICRHFVNPKLSLKCRRLWWDKLRHKIKHRGLHFWASGLSWCFPVETSEKTVDFSEIRGFPFLYTQISMKSADFLWIQAWKSTNFTNQNYIRFRPGIRFRPF